MADDQLLRAFLEHLCEFIVDPCLHVHTVGSDARLACMPPFQRHQLVQGLVEVRIVEHNEGAIPTELEGHLLQPLGAVRSDQLADARGSRKCHLFDERMLAKRLTQRRRVFQVGGQHIQHACWETRALR